MGVPFESNHRDSTIAPSPLNITAMFWNWQGGYKFESHTNSSRAIGETRDAQGSLRSRQPAKHPGFRSIWAARCAPLPRARKVLRLARIPDRVTVTFDKIDLVKNVIVADLGAI